MLNRKEKIKQVIDLIISEFSKEELDQLDLTNGCEKILSFKEFLDLSFRRYRARHDLSKTKQLIKPIIDQYRINPCSESKKRMNEEFEVQLFKPTFLFKMELRESWKRKKKRERLYELSYQRFLYA